jgi:Effector-associated domain 1
LRITVSLPLCDVRPFLATDTRRLPRPVWLLAQDQDFVRSFGQLRRLLHAGDGDWAGEGRYCLAERVIRFSKPLTQLPLAPGFPPPRCSHRRLLSDGTALVRVDVGIRQRLPPTKTYSAPEIASLLDRAASLLVQVPSNSVTKRWSGPLVSAGGPLASHFQRCTTKRLNDAFQIQSWWITSVTPLILVELEETETAVPPGELIALPALEQNRVSLSHQALHFANQVARVWFISRDQGAAPDVAYRLRIHLTRLHSLRESLAPVLRMVLDSRLTVTRNTEPSDRFQQYLDTALSFLERDKSYGFEQAPLLAAAYAAEQSASAQERLDLLTALQSIRPALRRQVARVLANENAVPALVTSPGELTGEQEQRLSDALRDAFTLPDLRQLLKFKLQRNLDDVALGSDLTEIVFNLIQTAERQGWTRALIVAAREANPGNAKLLAVSTELRTEPAGITPN